MSCGGCQRVRGWLPASIRARLEAVEARMRAAKKSDIVIAYTTAARSAPTGAPSPRHLPANPPGGDGGATIAESQEEHRRPRP